MKNILIWGTGKRTREYLEEGLFKNYNIVAIVDTYKKEETYRDIKIINPCDVVNIVDISYIVITNSYFKEIIKKIKQYGIEESKVVITDAIEYEPYNEYYNRLKLAFPLVYEKIKHHSWISVRKNEKDVDDKSSIFHGEIDTTDYNWDYFRYRTFELVADEINQHKIRGNVAEVGVFQGTFSALINRKLPDRKLYLFDTFEGFDEEESEKEINMGRCDSDFIKAHKDTSVEIVLSKMKTQENIRICKGFFPETITEEIRKEEFAFVSLDVDFEKSTLEGLRFFYPRLVDGGYIFIHDYNTYFLDGIKKAVEEYENELSVKLKIVPIADRAGTLIIVK